MQMVIVSVCYALVAFTSFKMIYSRWRGNVLTVLGETKRKYEIASAQANKHPYTSYGEGYSDYLEYEKVKRFASDKFHEAQGAVRANIELPLSVLIACLWPLSIVAVTFYGLWHLYMFTFFRGGLDAEAKKRSARALAAKQREWEVQQCQKELIELGKKELEES